MSSYCDRMHCGQPAAYRICGRPYCARHAAQLAQEVNRRIGRPAVRLAPLGGMRPTLYA